MAAEIIELPALPSRPAARIELERATARYHRVCGELAEIALGGYTVPDTLRVAYAVSRARLNAAEAAYGMDSGARS